MFPKLNFNISPVFVKGNTNNTKTMKLLRFERFVSDSHVSFLLTLLHAYQTP